MRRTAVLSIIVMGIFLVAGILVLQEFLQQSHRLESPQEAEKQAKPLQISSPRIIWVEGARQEYSLSLDISMGLGSEGGSSTARQQGLRGHLHFRVISFDGKMARIVLQLSDIGLSGDDWSSDTTKDFSHPFVTDFSADGEIRRVFFPPEVTPMGCAQLEELLRTFQVVVPAAAGSTWSTGETHSRGHYEASYSWDGQEEITKRKTAYASDDQALGLPSKVDIGYSLVRIRLRPEVSWIDRIDFQEDLRESMGGQITITSSARGKLERQPCLAPAGLAIDGDTEQLLSMLRVVDAPEKERRPVQEPPPRSGAKPTAKEKNTFRTALMEFDRTGGRNRSVVFMLRSLLREYPELAAFVLELIDDPTWKSSTISELFHLLEVVGTPEAQQVLQQVAKDQTRNHQNRLRSVIALGGTIYPTNESLEALWGIAEQRFDAASVDISNTASLSLGRLGNKLRRIDPGQYESLRSQLLARLHSASQNLEVANILSSVGNTYDPSLTADIEPYLHAESPQVRRAAAGALGRMRSLDSLTLLTDRLPREPDGGVRSSIVDSIRRQKAGDVKSLALVNNLTGREPDTEARLAMVRYLSENLEAFPESEENLKKIMNMDSSKRIRSYLARKLLSPTRNSQQ